MKKILDAYSTHTYIIKAFLIAIFLSAFIYLDYLGFNFKPINTLLAMVGFYLLLGENRIVWFWSGFFIGLLWFYWISFSFVYYELAYLIPFVVLGIAFSYAFLFWLIGKFGKNIYLQLCFLLCISFVEPFGFNWLKLELILIDTYLKTTLLGFGLFLVAIALFKTLSKKLKIFGIFPLLFAISFNPLQTTPPDLKVAIPTMNIPQSQRWDIAYQEKAINLNFALIEQAILNEKDLIIFPESAFPLYLNLEPALIEKLKNYSKKIAIVAGSLTYDEDNKVYFNSSYFFNNEKMQIAHKIVLVPFGEAVPLPDFIVRLINDIFFNGGQDYSSAKEPQDFIIKGVAFRSAICYEATADALFTGNPKNMIAISNNAWFTPSTEQTLQHLLLRLYSRKYKTVIYHSANAGKSGIITQ